MALFSIPTSSAAYFLETGEIQGSHWWSLNYLKRLLSQNGMRALFAALMAFVLMFWLVPIFSRWIQRFGHQPQRGDYSPILQKQNIVTMGGVPLMAATLGSTMFWATWTSWVWLLMTGFCLFTLIGALDDFLKLTQQHSDGLYPRYKIIAQTLVALGLGIWMFFLDPHIFGGLWGPFSNPLSIWATLAGGGMVIMTLLGASNAVNLTDGMDGLAIGQTLMITMTLMGLMAYTCWEILPWLDIGFQGVQLKDGVKSIPLFSLLWIHRFQETVPILVPTAAFLGAGLGFLWHNSHPATLFMGDAGAFGLGAFMGIFSVITQQIWIFLIASGVLVMETLSVILQVFWFRWKKKRIFLMSPLHHHFEKKGLHENKIVMRFGIVGFFFCVLAACLALNPIWAEDIVKGASDKNWQMIWRSKKGIKWEKQVLTALESVINAMRKGEVLTLKSPCIRCHFGSQKTLKMAKATGGVKGLFYRKDAKNLPISWNRLGEKNNDFILWKGDELIYDGKEKTFFLKGKPARVCYQGGQLEGEEIHFFPKQFQFYAKNHVNFSNQDLQIQAKALVAFWGKNPRSLLKKKMNISIFPIGPKWNVSDKASMQRQAVLFSQPPDIWLQMDQKAAKGETGWQLLLTHSSTSPWLYAQGPVHFHCKTSKGYLEIQAKSMFYEEKTKKLWGRGAEICYLLSKINPKDQDKKRSLKIRSEKFVYDTENQVIQCSV